MATPVGDSYSCASGGRIAAGRHLLPAWLSAMPINTWATPGSNTISSVDPSLDAAVNPNYPGIAPWKGVTGTVSVVTAWSGAAWDETNKRLLITGGGHADYAGNEVYAWGAATATFSRLNNPTGAIGNTGTLSDGLDATNPAYFDGRPRSAHTYGNLPMRNGEMWNFQGSTYVSGFGICGAWKFVGNDWVRNGTTTFGAGYGSTLYDPSRGKFIRIGASNSQPTWYDPVADSTTQMARWTNNDAQEMYGVIDTRRDLVVQFSKYVTLLKLDDSSDAVVATQVGTVPNWAAMNVPGNSSWAGLVYDYANDRYLVWAGGSSIYVLTPPAIGQNPLTANWVWSTLAPAVGNTITPSNTGVAGTYGRFWHSPSLNCVGVVNSVTEQMHVFRLG